MNKKRMVHSVLSLVVVCLGLIGASKTGRVATAEQDSRAASANETDCRTVTFKEDVLPVLQEKCLGCHYDQSQMPGLDLSIANAYSDLVKRKSRLNPNAVLVEPFSVADSFLVDKLSAKPRYGAPMPPYGRPLTPAEKTLLSEWIAQGAKDN